MRCVHFSRAHIWMEHKVLLEGIQGILSPWFRQNEISEKDLGTVVVCVCVSGVTFELLKSQVLNKAVLVNMQCVYTTTTQQLLKSTLMKNSHTVHIHGYLYCPDAYNNFVLYTHLFLVEVSFFCAYILCISMQRQMKENIIACK